MSIASTVPGHGYDQGLCDSQRAVERQRRSDGGQAVHSRLRHGVQRWSTLIRHVASHETGPMPGRTLAPQIFLGPALGGRDSFWNLGLQIAPLRCTLRVQRKRGRRALRALLPAAAGTAIATCGSQCWRSWRIAPAASANSQYS